MMIIYIRYFFFFFFSSRRRHTRSYGDWSSDVCSSDLHATAGRLHAHRRPEDRGRTPERPTATTDRSRRDESPRAGAADDGPIVDLDARGEGAIRESARGAFQDRKSVVQGTSVTVEGRRLRYQEARTA